MNELHDAMMVNGMLKDADVHMYKVARDYRVSGLPIDNDHMKGFMEEIFSLCNKIMDKAQLVKNEAMKNHMTGK